MPTLENNYKLFIIGTFSGETREKFRKMREEVLGKDYVLGEYYHPHITLTTVVVPDVYSYVTESSSVLSNLKKFDIKLEKADYFEPIKAVAMFCKRTDKLKSLFELMTSIQSEYLGPFYNEGFDVYIPHVTLLSDPKDPSRDFAKYLEKAKKKFTPFKVEVEKLEYSVEVEPGKYDIVKTIYLKDRI